MSTTHRRRKPFRPLARRSQGGWGLVDVMLGMIAGIVIGAIVYGVYHLVTSDSRSSAENDAIVTAVGNIQSHCAQANGYGTSGTNLATCLINQNQIPSGWKPSGTTGLINNYGGTVTATSTGTGFNLTDGGLPNDGCATVATNASGSFNIATTTINGSGGTVGPINNASSSCNAGGNSNSVAFALPY